MFYLRVIQKFGDTPVILPGEYDNREDVIAEGNRRIKAGYSAVEAYTEDFNSPSGSRPIAQWTEEGEDYCWGFYPAPSWSNN